MEKDEEELSLIEENSTTSTTDVVTDLKTGIYNLFVNLFHAYIPYHGIEGAIQVSTEFLEEITTKFRNALEQQENNEEN